MSLTLGATWHPRGEGRRLQLLYGRLLEVYQVVNLILPPNPGSTLLRSLEQLSGLRVVEAENWAWGRHLAVRAALETTASHIQYADLDRLLRWVETSPEEWRRIAEECQSSDCLIVGRSPEAYRTHPQALQRTEELTNAVFSHLLGQRVDLSAGIKGFSRKAAGYLLAHSPAGRALGVDAEWPVLLHRAGFHVDMVWADGLDWESADRHLERAASPELQRQAAIEYDLEPENWAHRVGVAREILEAGLDALARPLT